MTEVVAAVQHSSAGAAEPRLQMANISKTFGSNTVLDKVTLDVVPGEIHGLLGQNGSGKSTVIKILSGLYRPDPGAVIKVDGRDVIQPITPVQVMSLGLTFIHQSLGLIPGHSVTENVRLASLSGRRFRRFIDWAYEREQTVATLHRMQADIDPGTLIDKLHPGQRATVAIARALQVVVPGQGCVVLDESTQSLSREVLPEFYATIRGLAESGTAILIVSHRLDEVLTLADRVTILRDGRVVSAGLSTQGLSEASLAREILGRQLVTFAQEPQREQRVERDLPVIEAAPVHIRHVHGDTLHGLDMDISAGEIVGVTGATEAGHEELPYLIAGAIRPHAAGGTVAVGGAKRQVTSLTVESAHRIGLVLVPSDRVGLGLATGETAIANLTLPRVGKRSRGGLLRSRWQRQEFSIAVEMLDITPPDPQLLVSAFSGGNQQKLMLAKWLLDTPRFLVLHEPTQAVDVGARADILHAVRAAAAQGAAVLISSIEAQDLALVCDRVVVLGHGRTVCELKRPFSADDILTAIG